jgi:hypothetical protein
VGNCKLPPRALERMDRARAQVPWGKHNPIFFRGVNVARRSEGVPVDEVLPIVVVKDPYTCVPASERECERVCERSERVCVRRERKEGCVASAFTAGSCSRREQLPRRSWARGKKVASLLLSLPVPVPRRFLARGASCCQSFLRSLGLH